MSSSRIVLDPTAERSPSQRERVTRPDSLEGLTVGLLDISKSRGDVFIDRLHQLLEARAVIVERFKKPTYTRTAPIDLRREITARCDFVIEALAD